MAHSLGSTILARTSAATSPITRAATTAAGDTCLVLAINTVGATNRAGTAPTWNGVAGLQANSTQKAATTPEASIEVWYWVGGITSGDGTLFIGSANIVIPNTGSATIFSAAYTGRAATGFTSLFDNANGGNNTAANPSTGNVTPTINGAIIFAFTAGGWQAFAPSARTGTSLYETDDGATGGGGQYLLQGTAGAQAMTWTQASDDWGAVGVAFKEAPKPSPAAGGLTLTGTVSALAFAFGLGVGSLGLTGHAPTLDITNPIAVPAGSLSLTGQAPSLIQDTPLAIPAGALTFTGHAPTVIVPAPGITLVASISQDQDGTTAPVTPAIDTTGADLLVAVIHVVKNPGTPIGTLSDSKGNTWLPLTVRENTTDRCRIYYATNSPTVGSGHTVTYTQSFGVDPFIFGVVSFAAFSGAHDTAPFDAENGATSNSTASLSTGNVTPSVDGSLVVTALAWGTSLMTAIENGNGFSTPVQINHVSGNERGGAVAYKVQSTAAVTSAEWLGSVGETFSGAVAIASFKPSGPTSLTPAAGSLTFTGHAPALEIAIGTTAIEIPTGALVLSGHAPNSNAGTVIEVPAGSLIFKGPQRPAGAVTAEPATGALTLTGHAPNVVSGALAQPGTGTLILEGQYIAVAFQGPDTGILTLTGYAPALITGALAQPAAGVLTLTGHAPVLEHGLPVAAGSLVLTGHAPSLIFAFTIPVPAGALTFTGHIPSLLGQGALSPDTAVLTLTGYAPSALVAHAVSPAAGTLTLTGFAPSIGSGLAAGAGSLTFSGHAPTLQAAGGISPATAVLTLTGHAPTAQLILIASPAAGALSLTGHAPSLGEGLGVIPASGSLTLTGHAPSLGIDYVFSPATGQLLLIGLEPAVQFAAYEAEPDTGRLVLTGHAPNAALMAAADVTVVVPRKAQTIIVTEDGYTVVSSQPGTIIVP